MTSFRVATFNAENLFSRPAILNFDVDEKARPALEDLVKLDKLIAKPSYSAQDKKGMLELIDKLKEFLDLNEIRGKLVGTRQGKLTVIVGGRGEWAGGIRLKRHPLPLQAQKNTAKVISAVGADVTALVEVEDRITVDRFSRALLQNSHAYPFNLVIDGNDPRGIDVGMLSRWPILGIKTHVFDADAGGSRIFSRDCLEARLEIPDGRPLTLLVNHFKSKGYGAPAANDARRKRQAERVVEILQGFDLTKDLVVVCGDFNDFPDRAPLQPLLAVPNLTDVLAATIPDPKDRWTYKDKKQLDYLLVSKPLAAGLTDAGIERRGMLKAAQLTGGAVHPFSTVTSDANDASDHAAVWAQFTV